MRGAGLIIQAYRRCGISGNHPAGAHDRKSEAASRSGGSVLCRSLPLLLQLLPGCHENNRLRRVIPGFEWDLLPELLQPLDELTRETIRVEVIQEVGTQLDLRRLSLQHV